MTTVLIDYQSGNLHSARKAFERMSAETGGGAVEVTSDPETVARAERVVLPGDGAFPACRDALLAVDGMSEALHEVVQVRGRPFLGICVGMQLLASTGHEYQETEGLGWIPGEITRIDPADPALKVPHMGWNDLVIDHSHAVLAGLQTGDHAYFVHSYHMAVAEPSHRLAYCDYGEEITAIVGQGNVLGTQFHPEKSQSAGLRLIANFLKWAP